MAQNLAHATSGAIASSVAMTIFYPLDQLRMVLQADEKKESAKKSELTVARELFEKEGVAGFYKGLLPVLAALATSNFVYFYTYNALKTAVISRSTDGKISAGKNLIVASMAGCVNVLATCPLWVASTRLKLQANPHAHGGGHGSAPTTPASTPTKDAHAAKPARKPYTGMLDALVRVGTEEGVRALWGGTVASLVLVINPTLQFAAYEQAKQTLTTWRDGAPPSSAQIFAIAAYSKSLATLLTYPLQLIQTRMRSGNKTLQVVLLTLLEGGVWSWWRGLQTKLLSVVLLSAFQFTAYENIVKSLNDMLLKSRRRAH